MTQDQPEPIVVEVEGLGELEFPAGTPDAVIDRAVREAIGGASAPRDPRAALGQSAINAVKGLFSAPTLDRAEMQRRADAMGDKHPLREGLEQGAMAAASVPIQWAVSGAMKAAAPFVKRVGDRAMKGALKIDRSYLGKMRGGRLKPIAAREQEIIDTANKLKINPVSPRGLDVTEGAINQANARRQVLINAAPDEPVASSGAAAVRAGRKVAQKIGRGEAPQGRLKESLNTVQQIVDSPRTGEVSRQAVSFQPTQSAILDSAGRPVTRLSAVPGKEIRRAKDLTPRQLADTIEETNDELRGLFGDSKLGARARTLMGTQGARRQSLDRVAGTGNVSEELRKLIDLRNVQNIASHRVATHNPVSLTDVISLSAGRPLVAAGSFGMKPRVLGGVGAALSQTAAPQLMQRSGAAGISAADLARAIATLMGQE